jgi:hypothetical protein
MQSSTDEAELSAKPGCSLPPRQLSRDVRIESAKQCIDLLGKVINVGMVREGIPYFIDLFGETEFISFVAGHRPYELHLLCVRKPGVFEFAWSPGSFGQKVIKLLLNKQMPFQDQ